MLFVLNSSCNVKTMPKPSLWQVGYFDELYKFKNNFEVSFSEDGYSFVLKNTSKQTIYLNRVLSSFSSNELINLYNDADLTYRLPIIISPVESGSIVTFDCSEFKNNSDKPQTLDIFWIYDFNQFSKKNQKIERLNMDNYKLQSADFKKVKGMAFIEIEKISFCNKKKYKVKYEKY